MERATVNPILASAIMDTRSIILGDGYLLSKRQRFSVEVEMEATGVHNRGGGNEEHLSWVPDAGSISLACRASVRMCGSDAPKKQT